MLLTILATLDISFFKEDASSSVWVGLLLSHGCSIPNTFFGQTNRFSSFFQLLLPEKTKSGDGTWMCHPDGDSSELGPLSTIAVAT